MSRHVDIEPLENALKAVEKRGEVDVLLDELLSVIAKYPTADVQEVVRCNDCKYRDAEKGFCEGRGWPMQLVPDDGFCDKGERKTSDE